MNMNNKLVPILKMSVFIMLTLGMNSAFAEYYIVSGSPGVCCAPIERVWVPRHKIHHHRYHRHHHWRPRTTATVNVYYVFPTAPGCCTSTPYYVNYDYYNYNGCSGSRCGVPAYIDYTEPCAYTDSCNSGVDDPSGVYMDRRTGDDIGADLDIDY